MELEKQKQELNKQASSQSISNNANYQPQKPITLQSTNSSQEPKAIPDTTAKPVQRPILTNPNFSDNRTESVSATSGQVKMALGNDDTTSGISGLDFNFGTKDDVRKSLRSD